MPNENQTQNSSDVTPPRGSHHKRRFVLELIEPPSVDTDSANKIQVGAYMVTEDTDGNIVSSKIDKTSIAHKTGGWVVDMLNAYAGKMAGVIVLEPVTENLVPDTSSFAEEASYEDVPDGKEEADTAE